MRVHFTQAVMNTELFFHKLDRLVDFFEQGRHLWEIEGPDEYIDSLWMQSEKDSRAGKHNRETLEKSSTASLYPQQTQMHKIEIWVDEESVDNHHLSPIDAQRYLELPVYVVVENSESDGAFLNAIIHALNRSDLLNAQTNGWWKLEHAGGYGEIHKRIEEILKTTDRAARVFVLADSDREYPEHITPTIKKVSSYCNKKNIPHVILKKRKIENYLPVEALNPTNLENNNYNTEKTTRIYDKKCYRLIIKNGKNHLLICVI